MGGFASKLALASTVMSVGLLSIPALAQDASSPFAGPYAGAGIGMASMHVDERGADADDIGITWDALVGWRRDWVDGLVWGVEAHLDAIQAHEHVLLRVPGYSTLFEGETSLGRQWGVDGVIGHTFGPDRKLLVFGSVGYVNQGLENCCVLTNDTPAHIRTVSSHEEGVRLGLGSEMALTPHLSWRAAFYYSDTGPIHQEAVMTNLIAGF